MKFRDVVDLFKSIALAPSLEEARLKFKDYLNMSFRFIRDRILGGKVEITDKAREAYFAEALSRFDQYRRQGIEVTYPPEMEVVLPVWWGTRVPMCSWSSLPSRELLTELKAYLSMLGPAVCAVFYSHYRILLLDFDIADVPGREKIVTELAEFLCLDLGLPVKRTPHGGLHAYIPLSRDSYPKGGVIVFHLGDSSYLQGDKSSIFMVSKDYTVGVELWIRYVTHHPFQSYLWLELDKARSRKRREEEGITRIETCTIEKCRIPRGWGPAENWFRYGKPLSFRKEDVDDILKTIVSFLKEKYKIVFYEGGKLEKEGGKVVPVGANAVTIQDVRVTIEPITDQLMSEIVRIQEGGEAKFRGCYGRVYLTPADKLSEGYLYPFTVKSLQEVLDILQTMDRYGILPACLRYFLLERPVKLGFTLWSLNVVAWYVFQQLFPVYYMRGPARDHREAELASEVLEEGVSLDLVGIRHARIQGLRVYKPYYFFKFSSYDGELLFERPVSYKLLRRELDSLCFSRICRECPYYDICCGDCVTICRDVRSLNKPECRSRCSASRRLMKMVNTLIKLAAKIPELRRYMNSAVLDRIFSGQEMPLKTPPHVKVDAGGGSS